MFTFGVLDQSPIRHGSTAAEAVRETIDLAQRCEKLGYQRYWLAEHHNTSSFAGSTPEILISKVASETDTIRVGSGGVMMMHYSPLKVAENFRMLETLYPGRIDLGIGRAPGGDQRTTAALQPGPQSYGVDVFPQQITLLDQLLRDARGDKSFPDDHPYRGIHAMPRGPGLPEVWLLGSSIMGAALAGELSQPFCFAHFINQDGAPQIMNTYRKRFKPTEHVPAPRTAVGISVLCAETEEEAKKLALPRNLWVLRLLRGQSGGPFPSMEEALTYPYTPEDYQLLQTIEARSIAGTPDTVRERIEALSEELGTEEFLVVTITHDHQARIRSYELLADTFDLRKEVKQPAYG